MDEALKKDIERIKQIRTERSLTIRDVADKLGMAEQYLVMIELGEIVPTEEERELIEEYVIDSLS